MKTKIFSILLAIVASAGTLWASDTEVNGIWYDFDSNKKEASVTYRGSYPFSYSNEYSGAVTIPPSVTYNNNTYKVTGIGTYAFRDCTGLTSITLPNSVTSIGELAFYGCTGLTSVTIPNSVTIIGDNAFWDCTGLTSVTIPNSVTSIERSAFYGCTGLTSVTIPNSVTSIGNSAFYGCTGLTSITIGNSVTGIGNSAFYGCTNLTSIVVNSGNTKYDSRNNCNAIIETATNTLIAGCKNTVIPNSVTRIGERAFYYCTGLTSITIPNSVTSIDDYAFLHCTGLTSITIPNSVTGIGDRAFYECTGLTSITIPNSVTSIGRDAFNGCTGLTSPVYNAHCFAYMPKSYSGAYTIPDGIKQIAGGAFYGCTGLTSITIPNSVTGIGYDAFYGCTGLPVENNLRYADSYLVEAVDKSLSSYTIKEGTKWIGNNAFASYTDLTSITIPNSVTSIENGAFYECTGLTSIVVNSGNTKYDSRNNCNAIIETATNTLILGCKNTVIPNSVTSIGSFAFSGCTGLTSITIPNSVTSIGEGAFYYCTGLMSITIGNSVTGIGDWAFSYCPNLTSITIPNSVTSIGSFAFSGCTGLTSITLPNSVTGIGEQAFDDCRNLTKIFVPCDELERFKQMFNSSYNTDSSNKLKATPSPYTIMVNQVESGYVSVPSYNSCNESIEITAYPNTGYHFSQWSDGNTNNPRTIELTQDTTIEAFFDYSLEGKCGKDNALTWKFNPSSMALDVTGKGALSENYTYSTTFASLTVGNEVTAIGADAFSGCTNLKNIIFGSALKIIESGAFACSDIKTITCYSQRPPTVNNGAFCNLDYETIIYVPKDYVSTYLAHAFWGVYDVRPIGASGTETDKVKVEPSETTATVAWPTINGAGSYELVIRDKDGNALCTLVFNAQGQLTSIDFAAAAAPARDRSNVAAMAQGAGFAFTVTGLESGTAYDLTLTAKNGSGATLNSRTVSFSTQGPTALEDIADDAASASVRKVLQNGQLYILRDGKVYNATGAEVK